MDDSTRFRLRKGLLLSHNQGARFLTDIGSGKIYELNETASQVVQTVQNEAGLAEVVAGLGNLHPDVPVDEIERDTLDMLQDMIQRELLEVTSHDT